MVHVRLKGLEGRVRDPTPRLPTPSSVSRPLSQYRPVWEEPILRGGGRADKVVCSRDPKGVLLFRFFFEIEC